MVSKKSGLVIAIRYALTRWAALTRYRGDGRIEIVAKYPINWIAIDHTWNAAQFTDEINRPTVSGVHSLCHGGIAGTLTFHMMPST